MKKFFLSGLASLLFIAFFWTAAQATTVFSTASLTGNASITGFADGTANTFTETLTDLSGSGFFTALPDGMYDVYAQGSATFLGYGDPVAGNPGYLTVDITNPQLIYTGFLGSTGLTPGVYPFVLGSPIGTDVNFGFTINYDGDASPQVMAGLQALGFPFSDPAGAGSLTVAGTLNADGTSATIDFTESNLTWTGFGGTLLMADQALGGGNGTIDGDFTLSDVEVTANPVPEPATMLLFGLGMLGLAGVSRRKKA